MIQFITTFSYFSVNAAINIFKECGLKIFDCEKINTHGEVLAICSHFENHNFKKSKRLNLYLKQEKDWGVTKFLITKILKKK